MVIATAATTAAINSATNDDGLINQAFKLTILIGLALAVGVGLFLIWKLTPVFAGLVDVVSDAAGAISSTIGFAGTIATAILSATPLGRGLAIFRKAF